jgi:hypothetical protein
MNNDIICAFSVRTMLTSVNGSPFTAVKSFTSTGNPAASKTWAAVSLPEWQVQLQSNACAPVLVYHLPCRYPGKLALAEFCQLAAICVACSKHRMGVAFSSASVACNSVQTPSHS